MFDMLLTLADGDQEILIDLADSYMEQSESLLKQIRQAIADKQSDLLIQSAHSLKGASLNIGADEISDISQSLETCGMQVNFSEAGNLLAQLETIWQQAVEALNRLKQPV